MAASFDIDDIILNFDPARPHPRFARMGLAPDLMEVGAALPSAVPWPAGAAPTPIPLQPPPAETDDLSRFRGYEAVVVTWTAAEASAMASLFTPGHPTASWHEYRHDVASYVPLVTGVKAPFNDNRAGMERHFRSLGLYMPIRIGDARVLLFKSGLHLDYDGPATPVRRLMAEIAAAVQPKLFVTTGTGGGVGGDVKLGDVVIAGTVRFDCTAQFKGQPWAKATYRASALPAGALDLLTPDLTAVNAKKIVGARPAPQYFSAPDDAIVTTDVFAFDDSTDHYKLQGLGRCCDMGDAMVAQALDVVPGLAWNAIRNASDPQIANPTGDIAAARKQAGQIYMRYGGLTTAASLIAAWALVRASFPAPALAGAGLKLGRHRP